MDVIEEFTTRDKIAVVVVGVAVVYSVYQIGRIGVEWSCVGIQALKNRKKTEK